MNAQQEQRERFQTGLQPTLPDHDKLKLLTEQFQELQKKYDDLLNERSQPEAEEDQHQGEVEAWITATRNQANLKYRAQYSAKFVGKWVDQKNPQGVYKIETGFVYTLIDGSRRPVAYFEYDAITVFCEDENTYKGHLESQDSIITWRIKVLWYRNLSKVKVQRSKEGVGVIATESSAAPTIPVHQNATTTTNPAAATTPTTQTTQAAPTKEPANARALTSTAVPNNQDTEMAGLGQDTSPTAQIKDRPAGKVPSGPRAVPERQ